MLKFYLSLTLCLQIALINAARTRRGSSSSSGSVLSAIDAQEHVHIKVHIPDVSHTRARPPSVHHRLQPNNQKSHGLLPPHRSHTKNKNKKVLPTLPTHSFSSGNSKELPFEFELHGLGLGNNENDGNSLIPTAEVMHRGTNKYGPVLFTSGSSQQPISQQFMQQLFTPEMMSLLKTESEENVLMEEPTAITTTTFDDANEMMQKYFEKINHPKTLLETTKDINDWSPKIVHKRKKYGNTGIGETYPKETLQQQFYNTILKQQHQQSQPATAKARRATRQRQQKQRQEQYTPSFHQNFKAYQQDFDDDTSLSSDEVETDDENVLSAASSPSSTSASVEDMTTAFNGLKPISYQDMYGEYATPITAATTSSATANQQRQQQGLSLQQETIPSYTANTYSHAMPYNVNNWLQQYQRPEKQKQKQQHQHDHQQILYKPHHQQQHQHLGKKSHKIKSQQTQFVLEPTIQQLRLATHSPSSSSSSLSPTSLSTSPISNGFGGSSLGSSTFATSAVVSSPPSWSIPYDFVHQSYQQQLAAQQQPQQQQQNYQQQNDYELTSYKKHKNRTKRKRNRIIVE